MTEFKLKKIAIDPNFKRVGDLKGAVAQFDKFRKDLEVLKILAQPDISDEEFFQIFEKFYFCETDDKGEEFAYKMAGDDATRKYVQIKIGDATFCVATLFCSDSVNSLGASQYKIHNIEEFRKLMKSHNGVLWGVTTDFQQADKENLELTISPADFTDIYSLFISEMLPKRIANLRVYGDLAVGALRNFFTIEKIEEDIQIYERMLKSINNSVKFLVNDSILSLVQNAEALMEVDDKLAAYEEDLKVDSSMGRK